VQRVRDEDQGHEHENSQREIREKTQGRSPG